MIREFFQKIADDTTAIKFDMYSSYFSDPRIALRYGQWKNYTNYFMWAYLLIKNANGIAKKYWTV